MVTPSGRIDTDLAGSLLLKVDGIIANTQSTGGEIHSVAPIPYVNLVALDGPAQFACFEVGLLNGNAGERRATVLKRNNINLVFNDFAQ